MCELCINGAPGLNEGVQMGHALFYIAVSSAIVYYSKVSVDKKFGE